jgi:hypothetical protein
MARYYGNLHGDRAKGEHKIADENEQNANDPLSVRKGVPGGGVNASYLLRRLSRSRPALLASML